MIRRVRACRRSTVHSSTPEEIYQSRRTAWIYPSLDEFKRSIEKIDPVLRNMDMTMLQKMNEDKDKSVIRKYESWKDH